MPNSKLSDLFQKLITDDELKEIGRIIIAAAWLETKLEFCIWMFLGTKTDRSPHEGVAITGGMRTTAKYKLIKKLASIKLHGKEKDDFLSILGKAKTLLKDRDRLAHFNITQRTVPHGPGEERKERIGSMSYKVDESIKRVFNSFSIEELEQKAEEIYQVGMRLSFFMANHRKGQTLST